MYNYYLHFRSEQNTMQIEMQHRRTHTIQILHRLHNQKLIEQIKKTPIITKPTFKHVCICRYPSLKFTPKKVDSRAGIF